MPMNRRSFLKTTAATVAAAVLGLGRKAEVAATLGNGSPWLWDNFGI